MQHCKNNVGVDVWCLNCLMKGQAEREKVQGQSALSLHWSLPLHSAGTEGQGDQVYSAYVHDR